jgi:hypothetical protein
MNCSIIEGGEIEKRIDERKGEGNRKSNHTEMTAVAMLGKCVTIVGLLVQPVRNRNHMVTMNYYDPGRSGQILSKIVVIQRVEQTWAMEIEQTKFS